MTQRVIHYQSENQALNYLPDKNNTVTMTVGPGPGGLDTSTFSDQHFPSTPNFQEPAKTMDMDNQNIDEFLEEFEQLMERTIIDQTRQTKASSTQVIQQPIEQPSQQDQQAMTSDIDSKEDFTSGSDEENIDWQHEESVYVSVTHLRGVYRWITKIVYKWPPYQDT